MLTNGWDQDRRRNRGLSVASMDIAGMVSFSSSLLSISNGNEIMIMVAICKDGLQTDAIKGCGHEHVYYHSSSVLNGVHMLYEG